MNILIATEEMREHLDILRGVFEIAQKQLRFRMDKGSFLYDQITYLGYLIDENGILQLETSAENVESIINYPTPHNIKDIS